MTVQPILDQLAALAEARVHAVLLARVADELPGIVASVEASGVRLAAYGLRARAFGTRDVRRDPRVGLVAR